MHEAFSMPKPVSVTGRSSSITNSFINAVIPVIAPTDDEVERALSILGMSETGPRCSYCGDPYTEWDHLRPLVINQRPTGFISEIGNLVPACGKCNQSKGNKPWRSWIQSSAPLSPAQRQPDGLAERIERLEVYENAWDVKPLDFRTIVGDELWAEHWKNWERVLEVMRESQRVAAVLREKISGWYEQTHSVEKPKSEAVARTPARRVVERPQSNRSAGSPDLVRMIRTVGMNTFVDHFGLFEDQRLSTADIVDALPGDLQLNSRRTKASTGRRIVREGLHFEALKIIAAARNVDSRTASRAARLLRERQPR